MSSDRPEPVEGLPDPSATRDLFIQRDAFDAWTSRWHQRLRAEPGFDPAATRAAMLRVNPRVVLRNHLGQAAIERAQQGDFSGVEHLLGALLHPFDDRPGEEDLADFPPAWAQQIEISCSS